MISERCAKNYCRENISLIENYQQAIADKTQTWVCHHRLEVQGDFRNSVELLIKCGLYKKRPASELIFMTRVDHSTLHATGRSSGFLGKHHTAETKERISNSRKGKLPWIKGKHHTAETKKQISVSMKGKKLQKTTKSKMGESRKGLLWWNNGKIETRSKVCPGPDFVLSRIHRSKKEVAA